MTEKNTVPLKDDMPEDFNGILYFSHKRCGVCQVLRPKVRELLRDQFPQLSFAYVDVEENPAVAASYTVFTVPVILVFFEGQEFYRFARGIGVGELQKSIERPYSLKYG